MITIIIFLIIIVFVVLTSAGVLPLIGVFVGDFLFLPFFEN